MRCSDPSTRFFPVLPTTAASPSPNASTLGADLDGLGAGGPHDLLVTWVTRNPESDVGYSSEVRLLHLVCDDSVF